MSDNGKKNQNYSSIKSDCLKSSVLFEDSEFKTSAKSLFFNNEDVQGIQWKRPKELTYSPKLVEGDVSKVVLNQGELGNNWFVTACSSLAQNRELFNKVIPDIKSQEWDELAKKPTYAGVFKFNFWRYGKWVEVVIDDRLPTKNNQPVFCHSESGDEFWSALLVKAYAKLFGDFETMSQGRALDVLVDLTGGVPEKLVLKDLDLNKKDSRDGYRNKLKDVLSDGALVNSYIEFDPDSHRKRTENGLFQGYGYNVTDVIDIFVPHNLQANMGSQTMYLVGLRNPLGDNDWTGSFSEGTQEWKDLDDKAKNDMDKSKAEFWMSFDDFISNFTNVDICHFFNTSILSLEKTWCESIFEESWNVSSRNGGSDWNSITFLSNPQYVFDVTADNDNIMISLEQHDINESRQHRGIKHNTIGFQIMKVEENRKFRIQLKGDLMFKSEYVASRSVFGSVELKRGRYVLFPTTKLAGDTGKFMVRLYTSNKASGKELTKEFPEKAFLRDPFLQVTTITVVEATGLEVPPQSNLKATSIDPYVKVYCEGEKVVSEKLEGTNNPKWELKATFYRRNPDKHPIIVEIWNGCAFIDDFYGVTKIYEPGTEEGVTKKCELFGRRNEKDVIQPGILKIFIKSSNDLACL